MSEMLRTYEVVVVNINSGDWTLLVSRYSSTLHLGASSLETHYVQNTVKINAVKEFILVEILAFH